MQQARDEHRQQGSTVRSAHKCKRNIFSCPLANERGNLLQLPGNVGDRFAEQRVRGRQSIQKVIVPGQRRIW